MLRFIGMDYSRIEVRGLQFKVNIEYLREISSSKKFSIEFK
jgi:hypothetical protein